MIRLIATDLDDTLLNADSEITPRTEKTLRRAMEAGVMLSLSSGRMTESMMIFARRLNVNAPMILFNGALIYDHRTGETLFRNAIEADTARRVAEKIESMGIYLQIYPGEGYFCRERCDYTKSYEASIRVPCTAVHRPLSEWMQGSMIKMLAIAQPREIDAAQAVLRGAFPQGVNFMKSKPGYLEIVAEGIDKGRALGILARKLGLAADEVMAFGDGQNDASMLAAAGTGVAVDNAAAECKSQADLLAPSNLDDGVAQVIERFMEESRFVRE